MSHFAKVENGRVVQVIVAEQDFIDDHCTGTWVQTSYNTNRGKHYDPETGKEDGGVALRGNFAGVGMIYDSVNDKFYYESPAASWTLNTTTWEYDPPIPYPGTDDGNKAEYVWNEDLYQSDNTKGWVLESE